MTLQDIIQLLLFFFFLIGLTPILGNYMFNVFSGNRHFLTPIFGWMERLAYRLTGNASEEETNWKSYLFGLLAFNIIGLVVLFLLQLLQAQLPLNPAHLGNGSWHSALNTSISFVTNTNWQGYAGETTLSYLVQMTGLTVQNFVSAATGIAVFLAVTRGITRKTTDKLGNFWTDLTRSIIYVLLPPTIS